SRDAGQGRLRRLGRDPEKSPVFRHTGDGGDGQSHAIGSRPHPDRRLRRVHHQAHQCCQVARMRGWAVELIPKRRRLMSDADRTGVTLLAIDDDPKSLELIRDTLSRDGLTILTTINPATGLELAIQRRPEIVLLDMVMPGIDGIAVLERILAAAPTTEVILITGHYSAESAVEAIQKGASDYLTKPLSIARLRARVGTLIAEYRQRQRALQLDGEMLKTSRFEGMVGRSPLMLEIFARIRRAAPHFKTALVTGATGTCKELVARALHRLGPAASARFAVCNSSAIVEALFESELFGHVKGAFTGATQDKVGLFEYAA